MFRLLIFGLCFAFTISCEKLPVAPQTGPRVRITFVGLVAFVPDAPSGHFNVLLPDARAGVTVNRCPGASTPCNLSLPSHVADIRFEDYTSWLLADHEIEITAINPRPATVGAGVPYVGVLRSLLPAVVLKPELTTPGATAAALDPVVARLMLPAGMIETPRTSRGPEKFKAIQGGEDRCPPNPPLPPGTAIMAVSDCPPSRMASAIRYVLEADGAEIKKKSLSSPHVEVKEIYATDDGVAEITIYNRPTRDHSPQKFGDLYEDADFYWYYELVKKTAGPNTNIGLNERFVPLFKSSTATGTSAEMTPMIGGTVMAGGPRCMMARF